MKTELYLLILAVAVTRAAKVIMFDKKQLEDHLDIIPYGPHHLHHLFHHLPLYKHMGILPYLYAELSIIFFIKVKAVILVGAFIFFLKLFGNYYYHYYHKSKVHHHGSYRRKMDARSLHLSRKIIKEVDDFTNYLTD